MIGTARTRAATTVLAAAAVFSFALVAFAWDPAGWFRVQPGGCDRSLVVSAWEPGFCPSSPNSTRLA
jgi:hypothetical protein